MPAPLGTSCSSTNCSLSSHPSQLSSLQLCCTVTILLLCLTGLSGIHLFVIVALEAVVCHTGDPLVQTALLANADCNESFIGLAHGFCNTINSGLPLKLLSGIPLLPRVRRSCGYGLAGPALQGASAAHRWRGCSGGPTQGPGSGPRWELSWSGRQPPCSHATRTSSPVLPRQGTGPALPQPRLCSALHVSRGFRQQYRPRTSGHGFW